MFIIRSAFLLVLIAMMLPSDPREQARLYQTASHALHQAATFCDRNRATCVQAEGYWTVFREKLAVGARMVADLVNERLSGQVPAPQTMPGVTALPASAKVPPLEPQPDWRARARTQL